jgi:hypothetical protein
MNTNVRALTKAVEQLVYKVDGLLCHFSAIDGDYNRVHDVLFEHEQRLRRLEKDHNLEPQSKVGETSALFQAIKHDR